MKKIGLWISVFLALGLFFGAGGWIVYHYYPFIFARNVIGPVLSIERVELGSSVLSTKGDLPQQIFSFAVAVRDHRTREILTSSTEDRAWATIERNHCVEARFFPHPPWNFEKTGTFMRARLQKRFDCPPEMLEPAAEVRQ